MSTGIALIMERPIAGTTSAQGLAVTSRSRCTVGKAHQQDPRRSRYRVHHTRAKYLSRYDQHRLLCRQVDDMAVACSNPTVAQGLIDSIGKVVDLNSQVILSSFNGVDIDQRREYVKVSCKSYLGRILKTHGWDKSSLTEKLNSKPIEVLAASTAEELSTSVGLAEDSTDHCTLEKERGFTYRQVAGELTYAYVVGSLGISYAVTPLLELSIGESYTGDKHRVTFYLPMTSRPCLSTTNIYLSSPSSLTSCSLCVTSTRCMPPTCALVDQ
jgi:hypothetical protein